MPKEGQLQMSVFGSMHGLRENQKGPRLQLWDKTC